MGYRFYNPEEFLAFAKSFGIKALNELEHENKGKLATPLFVHHRPTFNSRNYRHSEIHEAHKQGAVRPLYVTRYAFPYRMGNEEGMADLSFRPPLPPYLDAMGESWTMVEDDRAAITYDDKKSTLEALTMLGVSKEEQKKLGQVKTTEIREAIDASDSENWETNVTHKQKTLLENAKMTFMSSKELGSKEVSLQIVSRSGRGLRFLLAVDLSKEMNEYRARIEKVVPHFGKHYVIEAQGRDD